MENTVKISFIILLLHFIVQTSAELLNSTTCDRTKCPGPLQYYKDLKCKPKYRKEGDCCAFMYDCDHLNDRSTKKCYVDDHEYEIGEALREEDARPCDIGCSCREGPGAIASFSCAVVDCFFGSNHPGCYKQRKATNCCSGPEVCPEKEEDRPTCTVDGKVYKDGEQFIPQSEPEKTCYCGPDYTGENVAPFCIKRQQGCRPYFRHPSEVVNKCAPSYYPDQSPQTSCSFAYRCQNPRDQVINSTNVDPEKSDVICHFGNFTMNLGDELNSATDYNSVCVKCVCEVGPVPTCQRLPYDQCDSSVHPDFSNLR